MDEKKPSVIQPTLAQPAPNPEPQFADIKGMNELGGSGTYIFRGFLTQTDYNNSLVGRQRVDIYDQMWKGDASVRAAYLAVILPIVSANWYIEPASDSAEDKEISDFVNKQIFENKFRSWTSLLREILAYLRYGSYVFEKVFEYTDEGKIGWRKWAPRLPKTIYRWEIGDGDERQFGIQQILPQGGSVEIPGWKLSLFINEQEGENYEGVSLFRSAYKHWWFKEGYYKIDALAQERQGLGIPYFKKPNGASPIDIEFTRQLMRNIRANEEQYLEVPMGWEIGFMDMMARTVKDPANFVEHHDRQITKSVLAQFLELGAAKGSGSKAVGGVQSDLFFLSEEAVKKHVQEVMQSSINQLVDFNYKVKEYPTLTASKVGFIDFAQLADALQKLSGAGVEISDFNTVSYLRSVMNLPDIDEDAFNEAKQKKEDDKQKESDQKMQLLQQNQQNKGNIDPKTGKPIVEPAPVKPEEKTQAEEEIEDIMKFRDKINEVIKSKTTGA